MSAVEVFMLLSCVFSALVVYAVGFFNGRRNARATRYRLSVARELAAKHESLMRDAVKPLRDLAEIAHRAGMDEEAVRLATLSNKMAYAVGMSEKLGG